MCDRTLLDQMRQLSLKCLLKPFLSCSEMRLNRDDIWLHAAPLFHLVDVFAVYAITLVGGRHVLLSAFTAQGALLAMGEDRSSNERWRKREIRGGESLSS